jgi:hypothetical protein
MNKKYIVRLTEAERSELEALVSSGKSSARTLTHARILLKVDADGPKWKDEKTAEALEIHENTVREARERFVLGGMEAALHRKKQVQPSRYRTLDGAGEAHLIAVACSDPPAGRVRWTLRLLANRLVELKVVDSISHETVRQTLKKTS